MELTDARLYKANLSGANLNGATYCNTEMPDGSLNNDDCPPPEPITG
jgi:uncharacterized protein YjbI with pentapeptide repeats